MNTTLVLYSIIMLVSVFISAVSQVLLKISANRNHENTVREYANPLVIGAYAMFVLSTLLTVYAYRVVPLSLGPVLEATSYLYVTAFGALIFKEKVTPKKLAALTLIVGGICVFALLG